MPQRRDLRSRFVRDRFHRAKLAAPISSSRGEKYFRLGIFESRNDRRCAETREQRQENSADFDNGKHRDNDFWNHRHEHAYRVPFGKP